MKKGVDIGGTFIKVYWEDGRKEKHYIKDISKDKEAFLERIKSIVFEGNPEEVGIAVAGFTSLNGVVYRSPNIPVYLYKGATNINPLFHTPPSLSLHLPPPFQSKA